MLARGWDGTVALAAAMLCWGILSSVDRSPSFAASEMEVRIPEDDDNPPQPAGGDEPAVQLPEEMTICRDDRACWSERGRTSCRSDAHPAGWVVRVLPVDESSRLPDALQACWQELQKR